MAYLLDNSEEIKIVSHDLETGEIVFEKHIKQEVFGGFTTNLLTSGYKYSKQTFKGKVTLVSKVDGKYIEPVDGYIKYEDE